MKVDNMSRLSWILQSWHEHNLGNKKLPGYIKDMVNIARKHNIGFDALKINQETKESFPMWFHIGATTNMLWNKKASKCLRKRHDVKTVGDLSKVAETYTRPRGCKAPKNCQKLAKKLIKALKPKFDPKISTPTRDNLDHTLNRKARFKTMNLEDQPIVYNPDITAKGHPNKHIRILGKSLRYKKRKVPKETLWKDPVFRLPPVHTEERVLYTKGTKHKNCKHAGIGIWNRNDVNDNTSIKIRIKEDEDPEIYAILIAIETPGPVLVKTESKSAVKTILRGLKKLEDLNWLEARNETALKLVAQKLRKKGNQIRIQWCKSKDRDNCEAKRLAKQGLELDQSTPKDFTLDEKMTMDGARLCKLTQDTTYKLILRNTLTKKDKGTLIGGIKTLSNITEVKDTLERINEDNVTTASIWKNICKIEPKKLQDFLWKSIHGRIKCGPFFLRIPHLRDRAYCSCGNIETEEHILLECVINHAPRIWQRVAKLWKDTTEEEWLQPNISIIRGIGSIKFPSQVKKCNRMSQTELYRTLVTLTVWTLWKNRNNRIFNEKEISMGSLAKVLDQEIKDEILIEWEKTRHMDWDKRALMQHKVLEKWDLAEEEVMAGILPDMIT
ncbi:hypothetical protein JOM56_009101 [Amanita muscaria]